MVFRVIPQNTSLQLELNDRARLMHLGGQLVVFPTLLQLGLPLTVAGKKQSTGIIAIGFQSKLCQRTKVNPVTVLKRIKIIIANTVAQYIEAHWPNAAAIHKISWFPHWISTLLYCIRASITS